MGDLGCLLSKCCLKVLGSGICVWKYKKIKLILFCEKKNTAEQQVLVSIYPQSHMLNEELVVIFGD